MPPEENFQPGRAPANDGDAEKSLCCTLPAVADAAPPATGFPKEPKLEADDAELKSPPVDGVLDAEPKSPPVEALFPKEPNEPNPLPDDAADAAAELLKLPNMPPVEAADPELPKLPNRPPDEGDLAEFENDPKRLPDAPELLLLNENAGALDSLLPKSPPPPPTAGGCTDARSSSSSGWCVWRPSSSSSLSSLNPPPPPRNDTVSGVLGCAPDEKLAPEAGGPKLEPVPGRDSQLLVAPLAGLPNEGFPALANDENDEPPAAIDANPPVVPAGAGDGAEPEPANPPNPPNDAPVLAPKAPKPPIPAVLPKAGAVLAPNEKLGLLPAALSDPKGGGDLSGAPDIAGGTRDVGRLGCPVRRLEEAAGKEASLEVRSPPVRLYCHPRECRNQSRAIATKLNTRGPRGS